MRALFGAVSLCWEEKAGCSWRYTAARKEGFDCCHWLGWDGALLGKVDWKRRERLGMGVAAGRHSCLG
eukprot:COSAG02_NODE_88_length_38629_cov_457.967999_21_plen_68_part_00